MHGTTVLPAEGVAATFSMNLAKKTITAIKKWKEGTEKDAHVQYRDKQLQEDPIAHAALLASVEKNKVKNNDSNFQGNLVILKNNDREWDS